MPPWQEISSFQFGTKISNVTCYSINVLVMWLQKVNKKGLLHWISDMRCPFLEECWRGPKNFLCSPGVSGYGPAPRPTKQKEHCATLVRSVGRTTNIDTRITWRSKKTWVLALLYFLSCLFTCSVVLYISNENLRNREKGTFFNTTMKVIKVSTRKRGRHDGKERKSNTYSF